VTGRARAREHRDDAPWLREADARTRTGEPLITSEVLYQLSYVGSGCPV
jgi:hypothetical protein